MKKSITFLFAIGLASCAAPKDEIAAETPVSTASNPALTQSDTAQVSLKETKPTLPIARNTGLRLPDMLGLPKDEQLRTVPDNQKDGKATVIARPPEE